VAERPALSFAALLRRLRTDAGLTQEELARAAGLSPRSVSDLERGIHRTARKDTAGLLADALGLAGSERPLFVAAARGRAPAGEMPAIWDGSQAGAFAAAATRALPRDISGFTGRQSELARLLARVDAMAVGGGVVSIHAIGGMAGIGKTTFAVHAAHRLASAFPDGQFFLPLHAHTAGQRPVDPADGLASLLLTAGVSAQQIPAGLEARAGRWRDHVAGKKILLLLDDAAGHEQVRPLLPGTAGSVVLITSRRRLTALDDAAVISLDALPPGEAAALLALLAARPGLLPGDPAVGKITALCGYLPLAIALLARQLAHHPARSAAGLAADLASASGRLAEMRAEDVSVAAALDLSYQDLTPDARRLFRRLGLVPGPSFDGYAAAALDRSALADARRRLDELYDHHLITEPAPGRYHLHDLLREHARVLAAADDPAESEQATGRLLDYYAHTAAAAGRQIDPSVPVQGRPLPGRAPTYAPELATPAAADAWLDAERSNLHAAVDDAAASGQHLHAAALSTAVAGFLLRYGHWDQATAMLRTALAAARRAHHRPGEADALGALGELARLTGDHPAAAADLARAAALHGELDDPQRQAADLDHLGFVQALTGDYPGAVASHQRALALARDLGDDRREAATLVYLGYAQQMTGDFVAADDNLARALEVSRSLEDRFVEADALNILGTLQTLTGDYAASAGNIRQSLDLYRDLGDRHMEACALNDLGAVQQLTGEYPAAAASHEQALKLFRHLGGRLGEAEALNNLGQLATRTSRTRQARDHHVQALAIARDLGVPLEEARALEGIGDSHLQDGDPAAATPQLRQALAIYQRIGTTGTRRVQEILRRHRL